MQSHQLANQTSYQFEFYSPAELVEAARKTMGSIDLDPASSAVANNTVKAKQYCTEQDDGLSKTWYGNVWMNHPWGAKENACKKNCKKKRCKKRGYHLLKDFPGNFAWVNRLVNSYRNYTIDQACCITYASTSENWFKLLKQYPMCLLDGRTSFYNAEGELLEQNTKGCAVTYLGPSIDLFADNFSPFGDVMIPYKKIVGVINA